MADFSKKDSKPFYGGDDNSLRKGPGKNKNFKKRGDDDYSSNAENSLKSMPVNADAERAALSCMLLDPSLIIPKAIEKMNPGYFYIPAHRIIYEALLHLYKTRPEGKLDLIILTTELDSKEQLDAVGGPKTLADLLDDVPTTALFDDYSEFLKEKFILRRVIQDCTECVAEAYNGPESAATFLDSVEKSVLKIRDETQQEKGIEEMKVHVLNVIQSIDDMYNGEGGQSAGVMSGFHDLDEMTNGFHGGEMIVIAARPSMGKTSFAMNIIENISIRKDNPVATAVFSLEMSCESLVQRVLCSRAKVQMQKLRGGFLSKTDFPKLMTVAGQLAEAPIWIDDTPGLTINELQAKARRLKQQHDIGLIAVDYLQLLKSPDTARKDGREKEVAEISGGLKGIAKELHIPIIVLAQLNRNPDSRGGKPRMSDLRESGSIEQDADLIGLLMRAEVYADDEDDRESKWGEAEFIIAKQRNGPTGEVPLTFHKEFMRFDNRAKTEGE
ncbi:replicative DNA helicase [Verrucomicrobiales bacterium BCK34]|nr:replicative DNA helicase [Verrucomicrobiales bacterium BCK34]